MNPLILLCLAVLFLLAPSVATAACGAAACPVDTQSAEVTQKGWIRLDYSHEYIDQDRPRIGRHSAGVGEIRGHHDEVSTLNQTQRFGLEAGFTDRLSIGLSLPFIRREHRHIHHHMGQDIQDSWNFSGLGDLTVLAKYALKKGASDTTRLSVITGGVLPTGKDEAFNAEGDGAEVGILPGKGAYSLILGASAACAFSARTMNGAHATLPTFVSSTYQWNGDGPDNYRLGNAWLVNAGLTYPLLPRVGLIAQANMRVSRRDDRGNTREEIQKSGGTWVYLSPGLQLGLAENLWSYVIVQLPVYQRVNSIQLTSDSNLIAGISYRFSAL